MRELSVRRSLLCLGLTLCAAAPTHAAARSVPAVFAGFEHQPLGAATLATDGATLLIDNLVNGGGVTWQLDAEAGSIRFGDGIGGSRPPSGTWNVQAQYRYGSGASGSLIGAAGANDPTLAFDFGPVPTNFIHGIYGQQGQIIYEAEFPPFMSVQVQTWPDAVALLVDDGELELRARWDQPVNVVLPNQQNAACDELRFSSRTGGALGGQQIGRMTWQGSGLDRVQFLGEQFREGADWFEVSGNALLTRGANGHELTHVAQQGGVGRWSQWPPNPCLDLQLPVVRQSNGIAIAGLVLQAGPQIGTRTEFSQYMQLANQPLRRVPTHTAEWTDHGAGDPGMTLSGGFLELGALSYSVQVFDDGLLVDSETGLTGAVAQAHDYVFQHHQTDLDFVQQRASAQIDLGADTAITLLASTPRTVTGDRIHIIPEQLQVFPDCVQAVAISVTQLPGIVLEPGVAGLALPPARVFGLAHQPTGDALLRWQDGQLAVANEFWGPLAQGSLTGGVRTPVAGLGGFRWQLAGDMDPQQQPPGSTRSFRLILDGTAQTAGLDVTLQNGQFAIGADFAALGSADAQVDAWFGAQRVYTGVLPAGAHVLADSDFQVASFTEDSAGIVAFDLGWALPQALLIDGQPVLATRVSQRLRHRDRAVSLVDFEALASGTPGLTIGRASVRPHASWLSAVGDVEFVDPGAAPLLLAHLDPLLPTGVEAEPVHDAQGTPHVQLQIEDPALLNALDGDEQLTLVVDEEDPESTRRAPFGTGSVELQWTGAQWQATVDFAAAGFDAFRVVAAGAGELFAAPAATGVAFSSDQWPVSQIVRPVGDELWIRFGFAAPAAVTTPASAAVVTDAVTLVFSGARPAWQPGPVQFLMQGVQSTALSSPQVAVTAPAASPPARRSVVLFGAVPNPFNPRTVLRYELQAPMPIEVTVYDAAGRRVRRLDMGPRPAGTGELIWDGRDDGARAVASGTYFVELRTALGRAQQKVVLVR